MCGWKVVLAILGILMGGGGLYLIPAGVLPETEERGLKGGLLGWLLFLVILAVVAWATWGVNYLIGG